jgi:serine/threonine protein kinase
VTELCSGGELFEKIVEKSSTGHGCFSEHEAARILYQILSAVSYMHKHSVVHRDIKPENILFETAEPDSPIKIIDFGLARRHRAERGEPPMSTIVGTPYYISPDVLRKSYDKSSDLWSVGVIAYILLCGYPPFNGASNSEVYSAVQRGLYYFPSADWKHVSSSARDFVVRLLQTDPRRRMSAEQAMGHPWITHHLHSHQEMDIANDNTEGSSFVEVVLDGSLSLQNESIVCGIDSCASTPMHC